MSNAAAVSRPAPVAGALAAALLLSARLAAGQSFELQTFDEAPGPLRTELWEALYEPVTVLDESALSPRPAAEARGRLQALALARPDEAVVQRHLGKVLAATGDRRGALAAMRRAEELAPEELWPLVDQAGYLETQGLHKAQLGVLRRLADRKRERTGSWERWTLLDDYMAMVRLVETHRIPGEDGLRYRRLAVESAGASPVSTVVDWLVGRGRLEDALAEMPWARRAAPGHRAGLANREVEILGRLGRFSQAREVLRAAVDDDDGLAPTDAWSSYVSNLRGAGRLEEELRRVGEALGGGPLQGFALVEAVNLLQLAGRDEEAREALEQAMVGADAASDRELLALATLASRAGRHDEASRLLYAVGATGRGPSRDQARVRLARLLARGEGLVSPSGLQALVDQRRLDSGPGLVGGGLSLLLGGPPAGMGLQLARQDRDHVRAARSVALVEAIRRERGPSAELEALDRELIATYRSYGALGTAYRASLAYLDRYPRSAQYFTVGLAAAQLARPAGEEPLALLRRLAREAAARGADPEHRRVLGEIEAELSRTRRYDQVVAAYAAAIDARPEDAQLYEALLRFLDVHNLHEEEERIYRRAVARFEGSGWPARYARWLTRRRGVEAHRELTRRLLTELGPSSLAAYLEETVAGSWRSPGDEASRFFLEVYRAALRRHPGEIALARRLEDYYRQHHPRFAAERRALLVRYAPFDDAMRESLYLLLATSGRVDEAAAALAAGDSAAARLLGADYLVRRARQREARPVRRALVEAFPGDRGLGLALADLEVSLGSRDRGRAAVRALLGRYPQDRDLLTRAGELAVEGDDLDGARQAWDRIVEAQTGDQGAYLAAATLYWDYYLFDDAVRTILAARSALEDEELFGYQLAAVHESAGERSRAVEEYVRVLAAAAREAPSWPPAGIDLGPPEPPAELEYGEYDDYGYGGPQVDPALGSVWGRLRALASRDADAEVVEDVIRAARGRRPDDAGLVHVRVDLLEATGRWDEARQLLAREAMRLSSPALTERAIAELGAAAMDAQVTALLERLAAARPDELAPTFRLAAQLEQRGHVRQAAAALEALASRLRLEETRRSDLVSAEVRLARLLYGHGHHDQAIAAAARAIELTSGRSRRGHRLMLARWLARLERHEAALAALSPILEESPDDAEALQLHGRSTVALGLATGERRQEMVQALRDLYAAAVRAARQRASDQSEAQTRVRALREAAFAHLAELRAPRAALDELVLVLNDDLENRQLVARAHRFAASHDLVAVLERRYRADAERSPRDHRLPLVLARLAAARGDLAAAAREMERSLAVAPERTDLRDEQVGYLLRDRSWAEAARAYRELAALDVARGGTGRARLASEAEMYGRLGEAERMDDAIARMLASEEATDPIEHLEAARIYARHGRWDRVRAETRAHLELWLRADLERLESGAYPDPQLAEVAALAVRTGRVGETRAALHRLERDWSAASRRPEAGDSYALARLAAWARAARHSAVARELGANGVDGEVQAFVAELGREVRALETEPDLGAAERVARQAELAELAGAAGSVRGQLALLELVAGRAEGPARQEVHRRILSLAESVGAWDRLAALASEADLLPRERHALLLRAAVARGSRGDQVRALEALLGLERAVTFDQHSTELERLLELRWREGAAGRDAIVALARPGSARSGQVVNFLLEKRDHGRARAALEAYARGRNDLWLDLARARVMLHLAADDGAPAEPAPFVRVLGLRTIGDRVARPDRAGTVLTGSRWAGLAEDYGLALAREPDRAPPGAARIALGVVELEPREPAPHVRLGQAALGRGEPLVAARHFALARELAPGSTDAWDGLARALVAAGRRDEALALWQGLVQSCETGACMEEVVRSMVTAGEADEGFRLVAARVERDWRSGRIGLELVATLAGVHGERSRLRGGPVDRLVRRLWELDRSRMDLLAAAAGLGGDLLSGRARGHYLREGLRRVPPGSHERARWVGGYVDYLVEHGEHQALVELLDRYAAETEAEGRALSSHLALARARALLGLGRRPEALALLGRLARGGQGGAVELLRELGLGAEAWALQLEVSRERLAAGDEGRAVYLAAVEALLELGRDDEALVLARRGAAARPDDLETLQATAELLAGHDQTEAALLMRRTLYAIRRTDYENLLAIARLELALGQVEVARGRATSLLARWAVPSNVEDGAADLLVRLVAAHPAERAPASRELEAALRDRALDEDRALALARILDHFGDRARARRLLDRSVREAAAPWRSLQLLARMAEDEEDHAEAGRHLEQALWHGRGSVEVARQIFLVRRRQGRHGAALAALGVAADRPGGTGMLVGLEPAQAAVLASEISDSAARVRHWAAADAYSAEAFRLFVGLGDDVRARQERSRLQAIRTHVSDRRAAAAGRPWIREAP